MRLQLKVLKADGTIEKYLHTKVIGTINNALAGIGQPDISVAENLAEVVTYFLYQSKTRRTVTTSEILSVIKAALSATQYHEAAIALTEHHFQRKIRRSRIEVLAVDIHELADAEKLCESDQLAERSQWDKTRIVNSLVNKHDLARQTARAIAGMVEERIFNLGITRVPASLITQIVLGDTAAVLRAQHQLQTV